MNQIPELQEAIEVVAALYRSIWHPEGPDAEGAYQVISSLSEQELQWTLGAAIAAIGGLTTTYNLDPDTVAELILCDFDE